MTFEHGRIKTWRLPRFSAFEMDLRQSARTCVSGTGEGSVLVVFYVCVCVKRPRATELRGGVGPPASDLEVPPASGETLGSSRPRAAIASAVSRARVVRRRRIAEGWALRGRVFAAFELQASTLLIRPYAIAAA